MRLYDNPLSGNCYKVRLFLSLIGKEYDPLFVDAMGGETKQRDFLTVSPRGLIPVLDDEGEIIADSMAILVYLARRFAPQWLPDEPLATARVMEWFAIAADELQLGAARARRIRKLGAPGDLAAAQYRATEGLALIEERLQSSPWLAMGRATLADIACYPYVALAPEGGIDLKAYPAIRKWIGRIGELPGYVPMPGL